jgi:predicted RNA-binding protein
MDYCWSWLLLVYLIEIVDRQLIRLGLHQEFDCLRGTLHVQTRACVAQHTMQRNRMLLVVALQSHSRSAIRSSGLEQQLEQQAKQTPYLRSVCRMSNAGLPSVEGSSK